MSYILDALRKSQQEHHLGQVPTLGSPAPSTTVHGHGPWRVVAGILAVAVLLAGGFGLALLSGQASGPDSRKSSPVAEGGVTAPPKPADPPTRERSRPELPERPVASRDTVGTATPIDAPAPPPPAPVPVHAPLLADLAPPVRSALPGFELNVHIHSPDPRGRFVFLNNSRYREGERTREGARVEAITEGGVVLDYEGTRFRLGL